MTTHSTIKKTLQNFHARNSLWKAYSQQAIDMDCSIDYLINEAMRLYAETHNFLGSKEHAQSAEQVSAVSLDEAHKVSTPTIGETPAEKLQNPQSPVEVPKLKIPTLPSSDSEDNLLPPQIPTPVLVPVPPPMPTPPPLPPQDDPAAKDNRPELVLIYNGTKVIVSGDQFIIGRGSKSSDLPVKDPNISRKHAAIIFHNDAYYMKDLGSTNGVEYDGNPVDSKRIDEGDVFTICGHHFHFTYQA